MVFTENQATQFYVVTEKTTDKKFSKVGEYDLVVDAKERDFGYLKIKGADTVLRTDLVNFKNILSISYATPDDMKVELKKVTVKLKEKPIPAQDYTLNVFIRQYIGLSDEDNLVKTAAVRATKDMGKEKFYSKLATSLYINFSREIEPLLSFSNGTTEVAGVKRNAEGELVPVDEKREEITFTEADGVVITEIEQPWTLGTEEQLPVYFDVRPGTVYVEGVEEIWGTAEKEGSGKFIQNGKKVADMEYFFMGERGDQYRNIGWPNVIKTKYLVDPAQPYYMVDIHYAYVGPNEGVQKSEKDIILVSTSDIESIAKEFETASGVAIQKRKTS